MPLTYPEVKLSRSNELKSNIFNNIFATLINIVAPLISIPILTAGLGMEEYGLYVTLIAQLALFVVLTELGFGMYLAKEISVNRNNINEVSSLFWVFITSKFVSFLLMSLVFFITSNLPFFQRILACFLIFFYLLDISPILMGLEKYKFLSKLQVFSKAIMVSLVLLLDFSDNGIEKAISVQVVVVALGSCIMAIFFFKTNKVIRKRPSLNKYKAVFQGSLPFYGAKIFVNIYQQSSTYFVSLLLLPELVAVYSIALQIYKVGQSFIGAVSRVLYTSTTHTKNFKLLKKITLGSVAIHLLLFPIVVIFGKNILSFIFEFDIENLYFLCQGLYLSLFFVIFSSYWGYPALSAIGKENYAHIGIFVSSMAYFLALTLVVVLNLESIYFLVGCILFSDLVGMVLRLYFARKFKLL